MTIDNLKDKQSRAVFRSIGDKIYAFKKQEWLRSLSLAVFSALVAAIPVSAADRIFFNYGGFQFSLKLESLEKFAKDGTVNQELAFYMGDITPEQKEKFREALVAKSDVDPVQLYRFFRTSIGEEILEQAGNLINIPGGTNGKYPLRGTLFQAAADPEGLTVLNFVRKFPTDIQLNTDRILTTFNLVEGAVGATNALVEDMDKLSAVEASKQEGLDFSTLLDIRQPGKYGFQKQTLTLTDTKRDRKFRLILYRPQTWRSDKTPVVIISHGLASRPEDFDKQAEHLASYGYVVALPQHPGSDFDQLQSMLEGYSRTFLKLNEFVDRPKDISYVIDELERRNQTEFGGRLDLKSVGVIGHSFGGYTALALAGATIDFDNLAKDCNRRVWDPNLSLLLQCQALKLPKQAYNFRDSRVGAIMAINPVNSSIFGVKGLSQIQIPVLMEAGSKDPATPLIYEQVRSFIWLTTPNKYLGLVEGQAHVNFSKLDAGTKALIESFPNLTFPDQSLLDKYDKAIALAFFEVYIDRNERFRPYLQSSYARYISDAPFNLYLVDESAAKDLKRTLEKFNSRDDS